MTSEFSNFAARLRGRALSTDSGGSRARLSSAPLKIDHLSERDFNELALKLFAVQFEGNTVFRRICVARQASPATVHQWRDIPAVPTAAFKEFDVTSIPPASRTQVFHSSGTTEQRPSRHFHCEESLVLYEDMLWPWFARHILGDADAGILNYQVALLTPPPLECAHSSLVHMFETVRLRLRTEGSLFCGKLASDGSWGLDLPRTLARVRLAGETEVPLVLLGTAFSFVQMLDALAAQSLRFKLPPGSRVMETGGYKGRSRELPKPTLHASITEQLGIPPSHIVCEYGMSELGSQAYDHSIETPLNRHPASRVFRFPPWVRTLVVSPETGQEVAEGETGLLRVFDLANVWSVMAIQTEDLAVRHGEGFELIGRAALAGPRGCSLMQA